VGTQSSARMRARRDRASSAKTEWPCFFTARGLQLSRPGTAAVGILACALLQPVLPTPPESDFEAGRVDAEPAHERQGVSSQAQVAHCYPGSRWSDCSGAGGWIWSSSLMINCNTRS